MEKLIVDPAILLDLTQNQEKSGFFFTPGSINSLLESQRRGYRLLLIATNAKFQKQIKWGKEFLAREQIKLSSISPKEVKAKKIKPKQSVNSEKVIYALGKPSVERLGFPTSKKNFSHYFFIQSVTEPQLLPCRNWMEFTKIIFYPYREAAVTRKTSETNIRIQLNLDGNGKAKIKTGLNFFDHMLINFCKHSGIDMTLTVKGDLEVDEHHTIEDTALAMGECIRKAMGEKRGMERYGFVLPMDESEVACSIDFSGRSHLEWKAPVFKREYVGDFPTEMLRHFYNSFCLASGLNMNLKLTGENEHHLIESSFKSFARCLRQAVRVTGKEIPSTKGAL